MSKTLNDEEQIKVIVGLGNPSKEFLKTRHNVGYWFLEQLLDKFEVELKTDKKLKAESISELTVTVLEKFAISSY